jgi:hypothetical protein
MSFFCVLSSNIFLFFYFSPVCLIAFHLFLYFLIVAYSPSQSSSQKGLFRWKENENSRLLLSLRTSSSLFSPLKAIQHKENQGNEKKTRNV